MRQQKHILKKKTVHQLKCQWPEMIVRDRRKEMRWKYRKARKTEQNCDFSFEFSTKYLKMYQNKDYLGWVLVQGQIYSKLLGWSLGDRLPNLKLHRIQNKIASLIFSKTEHFLVILPYCVRRSHTGVILFPTLKAIFDDSSAEHGLEGMTHDGFNHLIHSENTHLGLQKVMTATWIISPLLLLYFFALYMGNIP